MSRQQSSIELLHQRLLVDAEIVAKPIFETGEERPDVLAQWKRASELTYVAEPSELLNSPYLSCFLICPNQRSMI